MGSKKAFAAHIVTMTNTISTTNIHGCACAPLMTVEDLSDFLGVPKNTIYSWRQHLQGPEGIRVGKYLRFRREDVMSWLEEQRDAA